MDVGDLKGHLDDIDPVDDDVPILVYRRDDDVQRLQYIVDVIWIAEKGCYAIVTEGEEQ